MSKGHFGKTKMFETMRRRYYWPSMNSDIEKFVNDCKKCKFNKHRRGTQQPRVVTTTAREPFEIIELDLVGPLPMDMYDNQYILSIHCKFSRYIIAVGISNKRTKTVADAFVHNFVLKYGVPKRY